jgi:NAD(P)-dependent dehydrogenase (short-subunit alcohol dehydrogenase family)
MNDDQRKVALVTGCSQPNSLGAHICLAFRQRGYRVFATCRAPLDRIRFLEEQGCEILELDISDVESVKKAVDHVRSRTEGTLDALVQNVRL